MISFSSLATSSVFEIGKFIGGAALRRLLDPQVRRRILTDAAARMRAEGMSETQANHLRGLTEDKNFLGRGGLQDVAQLSDLIQKEVAQAGYRPYEGETLYRALVQALAAELMGNAFASSLAAGSYLAAHPSPAAREALFRFDQSLREPGKLGGHLLAQVLERAGQDKARLTVSADGTLALEGEYSFTISAQGQDAVRLHAALGKVQRGEAVEIEASEPGAIRFSAGHPELDKIMGFDQPTQAVAFKPVAQEVRRSLMARVRGLGEVSVMARIVTLPDQPGWTVTLADRPEFRFIMTLTERNIAWKFHLDWSTAPAQYADRDVLRFLRYAAHPEGQILDVKSGKRLLKLGDRASHFRNLASVAEINLAALDVQNFVVNDLGGKVCAVLPELPESSLHILMDMAKQIRGDLDGERQKASGTFQMTEYFIDAITRSPRRMDIAIRLTQSLALPDSTPLQLVKNFIRPKVAIRQGGKRIARSQFAGLVGQIAEVEFEGPISDASLTAGLETEPVCE